MSEIEKIKRYIEKTEVYNPIQYDMAYLEALEISRMHIIEAILLAFKYGQAKGYRAAKAEQKRALV